MLVSELIEVLKMYPHDVEVVAMWDGGWSKMDYHSLDAGSPPVVVFNVDEYGSYEEPE